MGTVGWTLDDLARTLREVAAERPDFVYERRAQDGSLTTCAYWHAEEQKPGCIFGVAFERLGMDVASIENRGIIEMLIWWFGGSSTIPLYRTFGAVQNAQDGFNSKTGGVPWGEAVKHLDVFFPKK